LKAVIEHKNHLILSQEEGLKNLRKKRYLSQKYNPDLYLIHAAVTLKTAVLNIVTEDVKMRENNNYCSIKECASKEMCCFLATLMHSEITSLHLPTLRSTLPFKNKARVKNAAGFPPPSLMEVNEASHGVRVLINAIGAQCSKLKSLHITNLSNQEPSMPVSEVSSLGKVLFQLLPRLSILEINCYQCDDWALIQIGTQATNLR
jgi:hypothetical protein